jgi:membrane-bound lytic murein transglycosylase A
MAGTSGARIAWCAGLLFLTVFGQMVPDPRTAAASPMTLPGWSEGNLVPTSFDAIPGWQADNHTAALSAFLRFCAPGERPFRELPFDLSEEEASALCLAAENVDQGDPGAARAFFEESFTPFKIADSGFVTGYFEPELAASRSKTGQFSAPLLNPPAGLERVDDALRPAGWDRDLSHGRRVKSGLQPLPDRGAIMDGALEDEKLEFVWLADPVDAFFVHVQGSARLRLADGSSMRVGYAGKTGHPYTSIARVLVQRGEGTPEELTMAGLRRWLESNPGQRDDLFRENRSFIFFQEVQTVNPDDGPIGAAGLPLVAGRSLAIDPAFVSYGAPVFLSSGISGADETFGPFRRLMIADDTGSAIRGPGRGDIFIGSGDKAGRIAGEIRHAADMTFLLPKSLLK